MHIIQLGSIIFLMVWAKRLSRQEAGQQLGGQGESGHGLDSSDWTRARGPPPLETPPRPSAPASTSPAGSSWASRRAHGTCTLVPSRDQVLSPPGVRPDRPALSWLLCVSAECRPLERHTHPTGGNGSESRQPRSPPADKQPGAGSSCEAGSSTLGKGRGRGQAPTRSRPTRAAEARP